ncbi:MAG: helix-turn-helix domain-containing protein, partial [Thermoplasmata archaeon]
KDEIDEIYFGVFDEENRLTKKVALDRILSEYDLAEIEESTKEQEAQREPKREEIDWVELQKILRMDEGQKLEFKNHKILGNKYEIAKTICAFANKDGGKLLIGVKDDRTPSGMKAKRKDHEDYIRQIARFKCDPLIPIEFRVVSTPHGDVYVVEVLRKKPRLGPFAVKSKDGSRAYFVRDGSMVVEAHPMELKDIADQ